MKIEENYFTCGKIFENTETLESDFIEIREETEFYQSM